MCGPAVRVLSPSFSATSLRRGTAASAVPIPPPKKNEVPFVDDPDPEIVLPAPKNLVRLEYTKLEAVSILAGTRKKSPTRGKMMRKMIRLGYTPVANVRSLQRLLQCHERGGFYRMICGVTPRGIISHGSALASNPGD